MKKAKKNTYIFSEYLPDKTISILNNTLDRLTHNLYNNTDYLKLLLYTTIREEYTNEKDNVIANYKHIYFPKEILIDLILHFDFPIITNKPIGNISASHGILIKAADMISNAVQDHLLLRNIIDNPSYEQIKLDAILSANALFNRGDHIRGHIEEYFIEISKLYTDINLILGFSLSEYFEFTNNIICSQHHQKKLCIMIKSISPNMYIILHKNINKKLLNMVSIEPYSQKEDINLFKKSIINYKPIVKIKDKYYSFFAPYLSFNALDIIENLLRNKCTDTQWLKYCECRARSLENMVRQCFEDIFDVITYRNIKYRYGKKDEHITDIDLLFEYDNNIVSIQIKGKNRKFINEFTDISEKVKYNIKNIIIDSLKQINRDKKHFSKDVIEFNDNKKYIKKNLKEVYHIVVIFYPYRNIITDPTLIKLFDINKKIGNIDDVLIIDIFDLMILRDFLDKDNFIRYLHERKHCQTKNRDIPFEEIEYLGYFLKNKTLNGIEKITDPTEIRIQSYDILKYYLDKKINKLERYKVSN